jgi:hypothetical protein
VNVKAQGLLNAAKWIEETHGRDALRDVIRACSAPVRERFTSAIGINWHPLAEFLELVEQADLQLGRGSGRVAEQIGAAGARANMRGLFLRLVFYLAKPELLMKRVAGLWRQFNDEGAMDLIFVEEHSLRVELRGLAEPNALFCAVITGWCREVVEASGARGAIARHVSCLARGQARCVWEVRYAGVEGETSTRESSVPPLRESARDLPRAARASESSIPVRESTRALAARSTQPPPSCGEPAANRESGRIPIRTSRPPTPIRTPVAPSTNEGAPRETARPPKSG